MYGQFLSDLSWQQISNLYGFESPIVCKAIRLYFKLFGYPDIGSFERFHTVFSLLPGRIKGKVLDVGSGNGFYSLFISKKYKIKAIGLEYDKNKVEASNKIAKGLRTKCKYHNLNLEKDFRVGREFSLVFCIEVLQYIKNIEKLLNKISKITARNAIFIVVLPLFKKDQMKYQNSRIKNGQVKWKRSGYSLMQFKNLMESNRFKIEKVSYIRRPSMIFLTNIQEFLFLRNFDMINLFIYPLLLFFAKMVSMFNIFQNGTGAVIIARRI